MPVPVRGCTWVLSRKKWRITSKSGFCWLSERKTKTGKTLVLTDWLICKALDQKTIVVSQYCHILNMSLILSSMDVQAKSQTSHHLLFFSPRLHCFCSRAIFFVCSSLTILYTKETKKTTRKTHQQIKYWHCFVPFPSILLCLLFFLA